MGYRSDVECCIYGTQKECTAFLLKEAELLQQIKEDWKDFGVTPSEGLSIHGGDADNCITFSLAAVKWYEEFEEVARFNTLLNNICGETDKDIPAYTVSFEFIRVGEDENDIEKHSTRDIQWKLHTESIIVRSY